MKYAVILGVIIVAAVLVARIHTPEPYPDAQSYEGLRESGLTSYDSLYQEKYQSTISDLLFRSVPGQIVLVVLAAASLLCLSYYYESEAFIALIATSPAFIATFTTVGPAALGVSLIAGSILLIRHKHYWGVLAIPICFSLSFPIGILCAISIIGIALANSKPFVALGASFFSLISGVIFSFVNPEFTIGIRMPTLNQFLGTIGNASGVTIFLIFLGIIGFIVQWTNERKFEQFTTLVILPCALLFQYGQIVFATFLAFYGARAFHYLWEREWDFTELRTITLVLIICGLLFTTTLVVRERTAINEDRVAITRFILDTYPAGTRIGTDASLAPILAYQGYNAYIIPKEDASLASISREQNYNVVIVRADDTSMDEFSKAYDYQGYVAYELS